MIRTTILDGSSKPRPKRKCYLQGDAGQAVSADRFLVRPSKKKARRLMARFFSRSRFGCFSAIFVAATLVGCSRPTGDRPANAAEGFQAKTQGPPGALMSQLTRLQTQLVGTEEADLDDYRRNVSQYAAAVVKTTDALLNRADVADDLKRKALEIRFDALMRTVDFDPKALDRILAEADAIEKERSEESGLRPIAAFFRVLALRDSVDRIKGATDAQYRAIHDAVIKLGKAKPAHPQAVPFLEKNAEECEISGRDGLARDLYLTLAEQFPDTPEGKFAKGNARRISYKSKILPNIAGKGFDGKPIELKSLRGKVVLIDFWAAWCEPCMKEMQYLHKMRSDLKSKGFEIFGINLDSEPDNAAHLLKQHKVDWPNIQGVIPDRSAEVPEAPLALEYGVAKIPFNIIVDRDGRYVAGGANLFALMPQLMSLVESDPAAKQKPEVKTAPKANSSAVSAKSGE